jgi:hypothetical protein
MERFNIARNYLDFYNKVQVAATYTAPRSILLDTSKNKNGFRGLIFSALAETLQTQPILGVTMEDEASPKPRWRRLENINLNDIVKFIDEDPHVNSDPWIQAGHRQPLERREELSLWRVVIAVQDSALTAADLKSNSFSFTLAFYCHHAIGDGLSVAGFHLTFLDALNLLLDNPTMVHFSSIIPVPKLPLLPTMEESTPLLISWSFILQKVFKTYIYNPIDTLEWTGPIISPSATRPPITNLQSFTLSPLMVNKLVSRCREEKTSITALIMVLIARQIAAMYPTHAHFKATVPCSLRKFSGHSQRDMAVITSNIQPCFSSEPITPSGYISCRAPSLPTGKDLNRESQVKDDELWDSTRACKEFLDQKSASPKDQNVGLLSYATDFSKFLLGKLGMKREHAFEFSNIGVVDGGIPASPGNMAEGAGQKGKSRVTFDNVAFSGSICTYSEPFCISAATARNGYMNIAVRWEPCVVSDEEAMLLKVALEGRLTRLGGE